VRSGNAGSGGCNRGWLRRSAARCADLRRPRARRTLWIGTALAIALPALADEGQPAAIRRALAEADQQFAQLAELPVPANPALAEDVTDPVFAFMVGLLDRDEYGSVVQEHFARVIAATGRKSRIPHEVIVAVRRARGLQPRTGWVRAEFTGPLDVPVPYNILGYHPGSLVSSPAVTLEEWRVGRTLVPNPAAEGEPAFELEDLTLWGVVDGQIRIDIDGWVDALLGGKLDDTYIVGLALFRFRGERLAMALGFNREGMGQSGVLDVRADKIRFPAPMELKVIARDLRGRVLQRLARRGIAAWAAPAVAPGPR
jgi:hypothetical protein